MARRKAEYRSSIKSRSLMKSALLKLLHEKPLCSITVMEIVQESGINRGTFYSHYPDIYALFSSVVKEKSSELKTLLEPYRNLKGCEEDFISFLCSFLQYDETSILIKCDEGRFMEREMTAVLYEFFSQGGIASAAFISSALAGTLISYVLDEGRVGDEDVRIRIPAFLSLLL